jgi:acetyl esterase/lipase
MPTLRPLYALTFLLSLTSAIFAAPPILEARQGFTTKLLREERVGEAAEEPPASSGLKLISYAAPLGQNAAYVSADPGDGKKHAAIIWLVGGFSNSISDIAWTPGVASNDQSASGFRAHGIVMMYPSLRGGNTNPGHIETFYGEVDDVLAAARHLASLDYVDPKRIYLGGHSTGGTLALLVAAAAEDHQHLPEARGRPANSTHFPPWPTLYWKNPSAQITPDSGSPSSDASQQSLGNAG